ncbi:Interleukin-9 [Pteropus alecto]|uniref:Interleukin-9 n=1 Tax=Pteropus alecto TaxID=9402 RepID=L5JUB3_PTEAL|nr:Interleukin-9 [Pteropus alecto]
MLPTVVLASAFLFCSVASQGCLTLVGIKDIKYLIDNLQDNCTTPCFQEGLSLMANTTVKTSFPLIFNRVKRTVEALKNNKCQFFSCEQSCNQTTAGNTLTFLKSLLGIFQKERMRSST